MNRRGSTLFPLLILAAALLAYVSSLSCPFIFDDQSVIVGNPGLRHVFPLALSRRMFTNLSFNLNYLVGGLNPLGYRFVNVLIHILGGWALYGVLHRTFVLPVFKGRYEKNASSLAGICALLWTVHPLQTESVTYISQRYESMMGLFFLLTLYAFVRAQGSRDGRRWYGLSLVCCAVGMITKAVMVCAPIMVLAYDVLLVSSSWKDALRRRWRFHMSLFLTWGIFLFLCLMDIGRGLEMGSEMLPSSSAGQYLASQFGVILWYLRLSLIPYPLCLDYGWPIAANLSSVLWPAVPVVGVALLTLCLFLRRQASAFLGLWFFCILAPTSSILPIHDLAFEHRMYLPLAAVVVVFVLGLVGGPDTRRGRFWRAEGMRGVARMMIALPVLLLLAGTVIRNRDYRSEMMMWGNVVHNRPENLRARNHLAVALCEKRRWQDAASHLDFVLMKTAHVSPAVERGRAREPFSMASNSDENNRFTAFANLGIMAEQKHELEEAEEYYEQALRIYPFSDTVVQKLGSVLERRGVPVEDIGDRIRNAVLSDGKANHE